MRSTTRTTLAIDDDVLAVARHLAAREGRTVGEAISWLARQGLARSAQAECAERNGVPLLPSRSDAAPVTPERVIQLRDELP